jgi:hypothetical protein
MKTTLNRNRHRLYWPSFLLSLAAGLLAFGGVYSQSKPKDTLFMKNGAVLSGELKGLKSGKFQFDADDLTLLNIKFDKIRMFKGLTHPFRIETSDRHIYFGSIHKGEETGMIRIQTKDSSIFIPIDHIAYMTPFDQKTFRTLTGYISSGFNYARSSHSGRFNLDGAAHLQYRKLKLDLTGSMYVTQTDTNWIRDRESLAMSGFYILDPWWSVGGGLKYQRNYELGLARRFQEAISIKYNLLNRNNFQMHVLSGFVVNQEKNTDGETFPPQVELPLQYYLEYFKFSHPNISLNTTQTFYIGVTERGRYRWDGDSRLSWELIDDLSLSLQFYHNFDNRPPSGALHRWDYGLILGLKYDFN